MSDNAMIDGKRGDNRWMKQVPCPDCGGKYWSTAFDLAPPGDVYKNNGARLSHVKANVGVCPCKRPGEWIRPSCSSRVHFFRHGRRISICDVWNRPAHMTTIFPSNVRCDRCEERIGFVIDMIEFAKERSEDATV